MRANGLRQRFTPTWTDCSSLPLRHHVRRAEIAPSSEAISSPGENSPSVNRVPLPESPLGREASSRTRRRPREGLAQVLKPLQALTGIYRWLLDPKAAAPGNGVPPDLSLGVLSFTVALAITLPFALSYRRQATELDRLRMADLSQLRQKQRLADRLETRRRTLSRFRSTVNHYVADATSRPIVPWTTAVAEVSRARPGGLWTVLIAGEGPRFKAVVKSRRSDLIATYTQRLARSPYIEYASAADAGPPAAGAPIQLFGRFSGE